ncbi:hypothetical protein Syun_012283 [Stephania yunnanensis]|uniref:Uncharacterized protein n=1 Tax=Stephania yunnanensis TaxID=152371 RepID=A0AAP0PF62_9MAGN
MSAGIVERKSCYGHELRLMLVCTKMIVAAMTDNKPSTLIKDGDSDEIATKLLKVEEELIESMAIDESTSRMHRLPCSHFVEGSKKV